MNEEKNEEKNEVLETASRAFHDRIKGRHPGADPQSPEDWLALEDEDSDLIEDKLKGYGDAEAMMNEVLVSNPEFASVLSEIAHNKTPPHIAIAKYFATEDLVPREDEDDYEAYQSAHKERVGRSAKQSALAKEIETNEENSIAEMDAYCSEKGYDETAKTEFEDYIDGILRDVVMKRFTSGVFEMFDKARMHDVDVADAEATGALKGKNEAIEAKRAKESEDVGDGIPQTGKGGAVAAIEEKAKTFAHPSREDIL